MHGQRRGAWQPLPLAQEGASDRVAHGGTVGDRDWRRRWEFRRIEAARSAGRGESAAAVRPGPADDEGLYGRVSGAPAEAAGHRSQNGEVPGEIRVTRVSKGGKT